MNAQLTATAYHEAGHAIAAYWEGIAIGKRGITIVPDGDALGVCHTRLGISNPEFSNRGRDRLRAEAYALVNFAGIIAQRKFNPRTVRRYDATGDYQSLVNILTYFVGSDHELEAYIRLIKIRAEQTVELHWSAIDALAQELLRRKQLSGREAKAFIQSWLANPGRSESGATKAAK